MYERFWVGIMCNEGLIEVTQYLMSGREIMIYVENIHKISRSNTAARGGSVRHRYECVTEPTPGRRYPYSCLFLDTHEVGRRATSARS